MSSSEVLTHKRVYCTLLNKKLSFVGCWLAYSRNLRFALVSQVSKPQECLKISLHTSTGLVLPFQHRGTCLPTPMSSQVELHQLCHHERRRHTLASTHIEGKLFCDQMLRYIALKKTSDRLKKDHFRFYSDSTS